MPESQEDIDALLAEVSALAEQTVTDIAGEEVEAWASAPAASAYAPPPAAALAEAGPPRPISKNSSDSLDRIMKLEVPVIVRLAERVMPLSEVIGLSNGAIIEFEQASEGDLDLLINNKCIGHGQAVKVGENFGLRVNHIGSLKERIKALGRREDG